MKSLPFFLEKKENNSLGKFLPKVPIFGYKKWHCWCPNAKFLDDFYKLNSEQNTP